MGPGTGFLIVGTAAFVDAGPDSDRMKETSSRMRAVVVVTVESATQTL